MLHLYKKEVEPLFPRETQGNELMPFKIGEFQLRKENVFKSSPCVFKSLFTLCLVSQSIFIKDNSNPGFGSRIDLKTNSILISDQPAEL